MYLGAGFAALLVAVGFGLTVTEQAVFAQAAPAYRNEPLWPQPLPNHWIFGSVTGVTVDAQNRIWVVHRGADSLGNNEKGMMLTPPTSSSCCVAAPFVVEFDQSGKVVGSWGGPGTGYVWPQNPAAIAVDSQNNVWIAAAGVDAPAGRGRGAPPAAAPAAGAAPARGARGDAPARGAAPAAGAQAPARGAAPAAPPADAHILKFSRDGKFLLQIGTPGTPGGPDSQTGLNRPAGIAVDAAANEVYVADTGNGRIVVFDSNKGTFNRMWGGTGDKPGNAAGEYSPSGPMPRQFRRPTCVEISRDNNVYVCDRENNRIQVFTKEGKFVREGVLSKNTLGGTAPEGFRSYGSVWDLAFSNDAQQQFLFVANGHDKQVMVVRRSDLTEVGRFGTGGRNAGGLQSPGSVAVDSQGNVYTGEDNEGKRIQKWVRQ
jgi:DNA-binding beta-propeller fold protein YncE